MAMYLYLISQDVNNSYDAYNSAVVCAPDAEEARRIELSEWDFEWAPFECVKAQRIGVADPSVEKGVVLGSFNAS